MFLNLLTGVFGQACCHPTPVQPLPYEVAAEDEAQDEDEDACAEDDHVDVQGDVWEIDRLHGADAPWPQTPCMRKTNVGQISFIGDFSAS